jgi:hypothetical protein
MMAAWRREWWAENGGSEVVVRARRRRPLSEGSRRGLGAVQAVRLTLGAHAVLYFPELSKPAQI